MGIMKYSSSMLILLLTTVLTTGLASAQPLTTSLHTSEDKLPAPQLEDHSAKARPGGFPLLECLNSLVRGNTAKAEEACSTALMRNPGEHDAYKLRGYAYLLDHRFERAGSDFQAALRLKPRDDEDLAGYAQSLSGQGKFAEAVVQYRKAVEISPAKAPYWNGLCWARAGTGQDLGQALQACDRALALQPGAAGTLNSRGLVRLRMKQFDRAISDYTASLTAGPLQASARFGRGLAWLYSGETAKGVADIAQARRTDPEIDALFALIGIPSARCRATQTDCPPGFPAKPAPGSTYLVAGLPGQDAAAQQRPSKSEHH
ncbi:MAG TPA: tetratricopeptide repeat protein [Rhizomicrobium sp.]|nr:tetratricopeptide repeat protein [Rhizomicrobium sp.]